MISLIQLCYIIAASLFITGLAYLSSPATARKGNFSCLCRHAAGHHRDAVIPGHPQL